MIPSPASHDNTLVDQLSNVTVTQSVGTQTNENSVESRICNIPCYSYKGIKDAVKYTYETIDAHPRIAISMFILSTAVLLALVVHNYILCTNREASNPITVASTFIAVSIHALTTLVLAAYNYTAYTNLDTTLPMIVAARSLLAAMVAIVVAMVAMVVYALAEPHKSGSIYRYNCYRIR